MPKILTEATSLDWLQAAAATVPADQSCVEVGVFQGGSLQRIAVGARKGSNPPVYGVDQWGSPGMYLDRPHLARAYGKENQRIAARSAPTAALVRATSREAAQRWDGPPIGLLHIDADHTYEAAMGDFRAWQPHLAPGAHVAFDDYWAGRFEGVIKAVDELVADGTLTDFERIGHHFAVTRLA